MASRTGAGKSASFGDRRAQEIERNGSEEPQDVKEGHGNFNNTEANAIHLQHS